jgi:putative ABC transport system permease protein
VLAGLSQDLRCAARMLRKQPGTVATLGSLAGLLLGYTAIRVTSSRYLALPHVDIATLVTAPVLISTVVLLACYIPALRAARLNALDVLRRV